MIRVLRKRAKAFTVFFIVINLSQSIAPSVYALTGGPTQPEVQSFQPAGTSEMVDLFTGDFVYNIPLFELPGPNGGYPFNLSYQAGIGMDQEASWVGLGWNLQPGSITRQMRGLPDEFKGDEVKTKMSIDPNVTVGLGAGASAEIFGGAAELGLGFSVYHNSYKGMGYSLDASIGFEKTVKGMTSGLNLGLSVDSQEGVGVNPSLNLGAETGSFGLGAAYNSKQGLSNVSMSFSARSASYTLKENEDKRNKSSGISNSASLSMAHPGYTPQITMPMNNVSLSATFKAGGSWWGIFGSGYVTGFYSEQSLDQDQKWVSAKGYGYLNYQEAGSKDLLDFNREKDGLVSKESPNLPMPSMTYDIYSVTGQGIGMMYRPMRNDHGVIYDQETSSGSNAVGLGVDVGPAASHVGVNLNVNHSKSTSGKWTDDNNMLSATEFQKKEANSLYEPWYFKVHGEFSGNSTSTLKSIGGDKAVRVKLTTPGSSNNSVEASSQLENKQTPAFAGPDNKIINKERRGRNQSIVPITNAELLNTSGSEELSFFKVSYQNESKQEIPYQRPNDAKRKHHFAGYTALTADGLRYVYGIPAYNKYQEEVAFSALKPASGEGRVKVSAYGNDNDPNYKVAGTDNFLKRTVMPEYAHSYLLTSIIGPDYVDLTNNGVTDDDLGYWVKFTYRQTTSERPYKWRDPYSNAHYQEGWKTDTRDGKGSYTYGEKELWYLARAETKSHLAEFTIEKREDGYGVSDLLQTDNSAKGEAVYCLTSIKLFSRYGATTPIKTTRFQYDYSLCPGIENSATGKGKLTLKKVWFEYGNTTRGSLNPYVFTYNNETTASAIRYDMNAYDRWGNYKPYPVNDKLYNQDFPYAEQDITKKSTIDANAASWSIKEIVLPSGGKILVDYESDDYAYVQNRVAMQMTPIVDPYSMSTGTLANSFQLDHNNSRIRFKLEKPFSGTITDTEILRKEVMKYIDTQTWQLYFKMLTRISSSSSANEYITGYVDIDNTAPMGLEKAVSSGDYVYGYFSIKMEKYHKKGVGDVAAHPFSMRAWQHLRTNQPDLATSGPKLEKADTQSKKIDKIKSLGGVIGHLRQVFEGYYAYCDNNNWGEWITADKSWIRLNSPDKTKFGGGIRVKQITLKDNWAQDEEGIYGQVYDYTMQEGDQTISSGVAAYEPIVGGDENAIHTAKKYTQSIPLRSDNNLFFEYPINESYYPGPQVGYSKVTVMSLPSAALAGKTLLNTTLSDNKSLFPTGTGISYGTSGMTVHEFYTAKEFPVITDETEKANKQYKLSVPVPFLGSLSIVKLTTSQGYSIVTNDMHGKPKKVSNYRQEKTGKFEPEPMSWVRYNYRSEEKVYNQQKIYSLVNTFKDNGDGTLSPSANTGASDLVSLGEEVEFFHDMRQFEDNAWGGGARYNTDIVYIPIPFGLAPIPVPTVWPSISKSTSQLRSSVSNKIIFRAGIQESIEAFDGGSLVKTENRKWNKQTGAVALSSVTNNFDAPVYSYTIPAYSQYQGMGAAYQNIGLTFTISSVQRDPYKTEIYQFHPSSLLPAGTLHPGDELLVYASNSGYSTPLGKVIYTGNVEGDELLYTQGVTLTASEYECMIVRSGYRNQLSVAAGTVTALQDPSVKGTEVIYTKSISVPK
jgi:hypothetical protein